MPIEASIPVVKIFASTPNVRLARIQGLSGEYIQQADITSISYVCYDLDNNSATVTSGTITVSSAIYDECQTGNIWTRDNIGYNFRATFPAACFPLAIRRYRVTVTFVTALGNILYPVDYWTISTTGA